MYEYKEASQLLTKTKKFIAILPMLYDLHIGSYKFFFNKFNSKPISAVYEFV